MTTAVLPDSPRGLDIFSRSMDSSKLGPALSGLSGSGWRVAAGVRSSGSLGRLFSSEEFDSSRCSSASGVGPRTLRIPQSRSHGPRGKGAPPPTPLMPSQQQRRLSMQDQLLAEAAACTAQITGREQYSALLMAAVQLGLPLPPPPAAKALPDASAVNAVGLLYRNTLASLAPADGQVARLSEQLYQYVHGVPPRGARTTERSPMPVVTSQVSAQGAPWQVKSSTCRRSVERLLHSRANVQFSLQITHVLLPSCRAAVHADLQEARASDESNPGSEGLTLMNSTYACLMQESSGTSISTMASLNSLCGVDSGSAADLSNEELLEVYCLVMSAVQAGLYEQQQQQQQQQSSGLSVPERQAAMPAVGLSSQASPTSFEQHLQRQQPRAPATPPLQSAPPGGAALASSPRQGMQQRLRGQHSSATVATALEAEACRGSLDWGSRSQAGPSMWGEGQDMLAQADQELVQAGALGLGGSDAASQGGRLREEESKDVIRGLPSADVWEKKASETVEHQLQLLANHHLGEARVVGSSRARRTLLRFLQVASDTHCQAARVVVAPGEGRLV